MTGVPSRGCKASPAAIVRAAYMSTRRVGGYGDDLGGYVHHSAPAPPPKEAIAGLLGRAGFHGGSLLSGAFSDGNLLGDATAASLFFSAASPLNGAKRMRPAVMQ